MLDVFLGVENIGVEFKIKYLCLSADGDRLFILKALGVADEGDASVLVGYHKTFS